MIDLEREIGQLKSKLSLQELKSEQLAEEVLFLRKKLDYSSTMIKMALALAHEIKQPLTAITAYGAACLRIMNNQINDSKGNLSLLESMRKVMIQAGLAGEIIHHMNNIISDGVVYYEETDINQLITDVLSFLPHEPTDFKLKINLKLNKNLPLIVTNKIHITQVILNLIRNSIEALQSVSEKKPEVTIKTDFYKDNVYVHIEDNGPGIPKEYKDLIFQPYFTTKQTGTGIGLGICRTLIEKQGGQINVNPFETQGACFTFTLPLSFMTQENL